MANRRMFSLSIVDTDKFLEMPATTQLLYFHLGMRADDDGFVSSPRKVLAFTNCTSDDMKVLASKGFIIPFESGIIVITHWKQQNYIQSDRYRKTIHTEERNLLELVGNVYKLNPDCIHDGDEMETQYSLSKDIVRDRDSISNTICPEPETAPGLSGIRIILNDRTCYDVPAEKIALWKETYPAVDIEQELRKMAAWSDANPAKRKTRRGIARFINSWLSREQDRGGRVQQDNGRVQQDRPFYGVEQPDYLKYLGTELTPEEKALLGEE